MLNVLLLAGSFNHGSRDFFFLPKFLGFLVYESESHNPYVYIHSWHVAVMLLNYMV